MYACMTDAIGTRSILNFMGYKQSEPCPLFEDSGGAQALVYKSEVDYSRAQAYDVMVWRCREFVEQKDSKVFLIPGNQNPSDMLTKSLSSPTMKRYSAILMGIYEDRSDGSADDT